MYQFEFKRAESLDEAAKLLNEGGQLLAGGQTMLASMKQRLMQPETLVDLQGLSDLAGICEDGNALVIGAMTRHQAVATDPMVNSKIPALAHLAGGIGDKQVRAMGTLGGSVANNDPAACYPSAVLGLGATVKTNKREIAADDFFEGLYATALEPDELITAVRFPVPQMAAYAKFKQPASRYALVGVFVAKTDGGVRVAITGAGNGVFRHEGLEAALNADFSTDAVENVVIDASDLSGDLHASPEYRAHLIKIQTQRAVNQALGQES
ncbi:MAG TPA: xanthine dehydrogenase family protein subunit M [Orrella sp.]